MKKLKVLYFILMTGVFGFGQNVNYQEAFWRSMGINGELELYGQFREFDFSSLVNVNKEKKSLFSGKLSLNT